MPDEAIVRILVQDTAQGGGSSTAPPGGAPAGSVAPQDQGEHFSDILKGAWEDFKRFNEEQKSVAAQGVERQRQMQSHGMDVAVGKQDYAREILAGGQKDLERFNEEQKSVAAQGESHGMDVAVGKQDYAREILAGGLEDLKRFNEEGVERQHQTHSQGMDALVNKQDYAREILAGGQEDLEKFQERHRKGKFDLTKLFQAGMKGDIGGAMKATGMSAEGLAAVAGPVAIVVAAKMAADTANRAVVGGIKTAGNVATSIADVNADVTVPMAQVGEAMEGFGEKLSWVNPLLGYLITDLGAAGKAFAALMQAVDQTAKHYEQYSGSLAMASAQAEVRHTTRDMARGQLLDENLSSYVTAKSKLENDVEDIKAQILNDMLPHITTMVEILQKLLPTKSTVSVIEGIVVSYVAPILATLKLIKWLMPAPAEKNIGDPTAQLFEIGGIGVPDA